MRIHIHTSTHTHTQWFCSTLGVSYHLVVPQSLGGLYGPVQAGLAYVHVLGVGEVGQQLHQGPHIHVVVVIHMTEPSGKGEDSENIG